MNKTFLFLFSGMFKSSSRIVIDINVNSSNCKSSNRIPIVNISKTAPVLASIVYNSVDDLLYYGNGKSWSPIGTGNQLTPIFPGDDIPIIPDYVICGGGTVALALAASLSSDNTTRVLVLEMGNDNSTNPLVTQPFSPAPYRGNGPTILNAFSVTMDPSITSFNGAPQGPGDGYSFYPLWTGTGFGGGNQHFLFLKVNPSQVLIDGPLPAGIIPPSNVTVFPFATAGSNSSIPSAWSYSNISNIVKSQENFQLFTGFGTSVPGLSENPSERGYSGPLSALQLSGYPPVGESLIVQQAFSNAAGGLNGAPIVPGGAPANLVEDYNCNISFADGQTQLNCVSQMQNYLTNIFLRQGSQTAFIGGNITASDGNGNQIGINGRKLIILSKTNVINPVKGTGSIYTAAGVMCLQKETLKFVPAKNIVCSMGAGYSPRFWQLGGIGPADLLNNLGIPKQIIGPSVEFIGKNLHVQYGPLIAVKSSNQYFNTTQFPGQAFVQYNGTARKLQCIALSSTPVSLGLFGGTYVPLEFIPTSWTASITSNTMTVTVAPVGGSIQIGMLISGAGVANGTYVTTFVSGTGGVGTYTLSGSPQTVSSTVMSAVQEFQMQFDGFICNPRSRGGYSNTTSSVFRPQLDFSWGVFTDVPISNFTGTIIGNTLTTTIASPVPLLVGQTITGPGVTQGTIITAVLSGQGAVTAGLTYPAPSNGATYQVSPTYDGTGGNPAPISTPTAMSLDSNNPLSGLSDPASDISTCCAFADYIYQTVKQMRLLDPTNTYTLISPPNIENIFVITPAIERWRQLATIIPYYIAFSSHEQGTVVMSNSPSSGAVDGNLKLYETTNCFQCDGSIMPVQNAGNPTALQHAIGVIGSQVIPTVAL
jgi:hypothetical protein